ncbi:unnamed protein product [Medioppia subpectinata]|uniref:Lipoyl-binding domain-containing protein n=1 Tax=Medioppia subpectinata TaxID=1979941 RepID=A0A7R9Q4Q1_9ACAR|nr:unnamed protein product [Medioppia subpectinata]CAG2112903.1 unnamed protein product [Medioppia subpectinata]
MSSAMYPKVCDEFIQFRREFGPVSLFDTRIFLTGPKVGEEFEVTLEKGKVLHITTLAVSETRTDTGEREVFFELNGQLRSFLVKDKAVTTEIKSNPKALKGVKGSVGAPMPGTVIEVRVQEGDKIEKGQPLIVLSAMKMEMIVQSPVAGTVKKIFAAKDMKLEGDDLVMDIEVD